MFTTIVDHMLALEFDQPDKARMLTVHRCWKWAHRLTSPPSGITFLTCGIGRESHGLG